MYETVPIGAPVAVRTRSRPLDSRGSWAMPKSRILSTPPRVRKRFSGLRSRWTMPCSCAATRPRDLALQVARGLVAAHEHRIVHRDLQREIRGSRGGQRTARKRLAQRFAVEQLGDEIGLAILVAGIVHDYDIRMIQRPRRPRFPLESADMVLVVLAVEQHLDR